LCPVNISVNCNKSKNKAVQILKYQEFALWGHKKAFEWHQSESKGKSLFDFRSKFYGYHFSSWPTLPYNLVFFLFLSMNFLKIFSYSLKIIKSVSFVRPCVFLSGLDRFLYFGSPLWTIATYFTPVWKDIITHMIYYNTIGECV
jgi:hypothetical protein